MRRMVLVVALAACGGGEKPVTKPMAPSRAEIEQRAVVAERARAKAALERDAGAELLALGVDVDRFEPIARNLFDRWRVAHPEWKPAPDPPPKTVYVPAPTPSPRRPAAPSFAWWCYDTNNLVASMSFRFCHPSLESCEANRAGQRDPLLASECQGQDHAACFTATSKLSGEKKAWCFDMLSSCGAARKAVASWGEDYGPPTKCKAI